MIPVLLYYMNFLSESRLSAVYYWIAPLTLVLSSRPLRLFSRDTGLTWPSGRRPVRVLCGAPSIDFSFLELRPVLFRRSALDQYAIFDCAASSVRYKLRLPRLSDTHRLPSLGEHLITHGGHPVVSYVVDGSASIRWRRPRRARVSVESLMGPCLDLSFQVSSRSLWMCIGLVREPCLPAHGYQRIRRTALGLVAAATPPRVKLPTPPPRTSPQPTFRISRNLPREFPRLHIVEHMRSSPRMPRCLLMKSRPFLFASANSLTSLLPTSSIMSFRLRDLRVGGEARSPVHLEFMCTRIPASDVFPRAVRPCTGHALYDYRISNCVVPFTIASSAARTTFSIYGFFFLFLT